MYVYIIWTIILVDSFSYMNLLILILGVLYMELQKMKNIKQCYEDMLLKKCIPFWIEFGIDKEKGGIWTCVDETGKVYDTDKSVWFQGRSLWMLSVMYNNVEKNPEWLEAAGHIYRFLDEKCFAPDGKMYLSVTTDGSPLYKSSEVFSETFAIIGLAEYAKATGDEKIKKQAIDLYMSLINYYKNKDFSEGGFGRMGGPGRKHNLPMIMLTTTQTMRGIDDSNDYNEFAEYFYNEIIQNFYREDRKILLECVGANGEDIDNFMGKSINPGHSIESSWFIMQEGIYRNDEAIMKRGIEIFETAIELGWDKEYGGLYPYINLDNEKVEFFEMEKKVWWPQTEALYASLLAYAITNDSKYEEWYNKIHSYFMTYFINDDFSDCYESLHRKGEAPTKFMGDMWKGPFHYPRALYLCINRLDEMINGMELYENNRIKA